MGCTDRPGERLISNKLTVVVSMNINENKAEGRRMYIWKGIVISLHMLVTVQCWHFPRYVRLQHL